jgi:hypothetical protein
MHALNLFGECATAIEENRKNRSEQENRELHYFQRFKAFSVTYDPNDAEDESSSAYEGRDGRTIEMKMKVYLLLKTAMKRSGIQN